jgi:hypothetical protein
MNVLKVYVKMHNGWKTMGTSWMCMFRWRKQLHKTSGGVYEKFENNNNWLF